MRYLLTVQAYREDPGFFEKESQKPKSIVINQNPFDWWSNRVWASMPEFAGYNALHILCIVPEKEAHA